MADSNWKHRGTPAYFQVCSRIEDDDQRAGDNAHGYWIWTVAVRIEDTIFLFAPRAFLRPSVSINNRRLHQHWCAYVEWQCSCEEQRQYTLKPTLSECVLFIRPGNMSFAKYTHYLLTSIRFDLLLIVHSFYPLQQTHTLDSPTHVNSCMHALSFRICIATPHSIQLLPLARGIRRNV